MKLIAPAWFIVVVLTAACTQSEPPSSQPAAPAPAPAAVGTEGRLFVTNENGGDISVIDVASQRVGPGVFD